MQISAISTAKVPSTTANSIQVMKVCQALARNGHAVRLYLPGSRSTPWEELAGHYGLSTPFQMEWLAVRRGLRHNDFAVRAVLQARTEPRKRGQDHWIYTWSFQAAVLGLLARRHVLLEVHDLPTGRLGPLWLKTFLRLPGVKRLGVISQALGNALEERLSLRLPKDTCILPNGLDLDLYAGLPAAPEARARLGFEQGLTALCSGHLYYGRGGELFLELAKRFPAQRFVWVGGRPTDVQYHRDLAAEKGITNLRFTGHVPQERLPLYQACADVLLMPYGSVVAGSGGGNSAMICSPMKLFDYLGAGRAILTSELPPIREILGIDDAIFAPPDDADAWAKALGMLFDDPGLRSRLAERAAALAPRYSWQAREEKCFP